jgi:hypothetical protein
LLLQKLKNERIFQNSSKLIFCFVFQIMLLARRSFERIGIRHRYPDQRSFDHFDGQKKGQQNVPPSHDQPLMLGPGKLMRFD